MTLAEIVSKIHLPQTTSHKGQNGKVLIIGGSDLFHAASQWSFTAASRLVDMTFYSSVVENNEILRDAKQFATDGVVIPRSDLSSYIQEVDVILIGPGMRRDHASRFSPQQLNTLTTTDLSLEDWESDTAAITAALLHDWPQKKWVIDAGALQLLDPTWIPPRAILTPHAQEFSRLLPIDLTQIRAPYSSSESLPANIEEKTLSQLQEFSANHNNCTVILKGPIDLIFDNQRGVAISGGNAGMTKGGTGDALAGLVAGFFAKSESFESAVIASYLNKQAAHDLYQKQAMMYNTTDLVNQIPLTWKQISSSNDE